METAICNYLFTGLHWSAKISRGLTLFLLFPEGAIANRVKGVHDNLSEGNKRMNQVAASIGQSVNELQRVASIHSKLLADVRSLIASMNKADHYDVPQINNYLTQYR